MKRSRMKPWRPKGYGPEVKLWASQWHNCWRCGRRGGWKNGLEIHHFVRGSSRQRDDLRTVVMLCWECHRVREHGLGGDPLGVIGCLQLKKRFDGDWYDLKAVNEMRGRAEGAITREEVDAAEAAKESRNA